MLDIAAEVVVVDVIDSQRARRVRCGSACRLLAGMEIDMTRHRAHKLAVRDRMARTGETYTAARVAVEQERGPAPRAAFAPTAQLDRYVASGYPELAGMTEQAFRAWLDPLVSDETTDVYDPATGCVDAVLVIRQRVVGADAAMARVTLKGRPGYVDMNPSEPGAFTETDIVSAPDADAYVLLGFDPGDGYRNEPPSAVLPKLLQVGRSPVTIDEAISAAVLHPELIAHKHAFSILGSRSDAPKVGQSVPAIWISRGAPRLGWCWDNNPHTWLGSASCAGRAVPL